MDIKQIRFSEKQDEFANWFQESHRELGRKLKSVDEFSKIVTGAFDVFMKLDQSKKENFLRYRAEYQKYFLYQLNERIGYRDQLQFVYEQIQEIQLKIGDAKADDHRYHQQIYENVLNDLVLPCKERLLELVRLEHEIGPLQKNENQQGVPETVSRNEDKANEKPVEEKPKPQPIDDEEYSPEKPAFIEIPVNIVDPPLVTKTGKTMNNALHVAKQRKFTWSDERIPDWIADILLDRKLIFDVQLSYTKEFLIMAKCNRKIVFRGNGNILTTIFYQLKESGQKYVTISTTFLAERIEQIFVSEDDTLTPLITKAACREDMKPANITRRLKKGSPNYVDIKAYLEKKLAPTQ